MSLQYVQTNTLYLAGSGVIVGATSIVLQSFADIYGNNLAITDFGAKGYITLEPDTINEEAATFTGVTTNSNGTVTLTGISSGLAKSPYTETSGLVRAHSGGTKVVVTDNVEFWATFTNKNNAEVLTTNWQAPTPLGASDLATKGYVDALVSGGTVSYNQEIIAGTAGENLTRAQVVYLKNDGKWWKASAAAAATSLNVKLGICQTTALATAATTILISGLDQSQSGLVTGTLYYMSDTLGAISSSAGTISIDLGEAINGTSFVFSPFTATTKVLSSVSNVRTSTTGSLNNVPLGPSAGAPNLDLTWLPATTGTTDQSQATQNGTITLGEQNLTTKHYLVGQKFVPARQSISGVTLYKIADSGSFTGTVKIAIQADTAGSPTGVDLASYTITNAAWLKLTAAANFTVSFTTEYETLTVGGSYWIVVTPSTTDNTNHPNLGLNTAGGYAAGALKYNNTADGWVTVATSILTFVTIDGVLSKLPRTGTTDGLLPMLPSRYALLAYDTNTSTVTATTSETTVYSKLVSGGFFTANSGLRSRVFGTFDTNSGGSTCLIKLKYNGTSFLSQTISGGSNTGWAKFSLVVEWNVINNASVSSQAILGQVSLQPIAVGGGTIAAASLVLNSNAGVNNGTSAIDTATPGLLEVTVTNSSAAGTTAFVYQQTIVEKIA